ncbi:MAG: hypothetical protein IJE84_02320, partial [Clostridia bacterium]|nr:hypothetical protein [Clostridia bacterium]
MIKNKKLKLLAFVGAVILVAVVGLLISIAIGNSNNTVKQDVTIEDAQALIDAQLDKLPNNVAYCSQYLEENTEITVKDLEYGNQKNVTLSCTYKTLDIYSVIKDNIDYLLDIDLFNEGSGTQKNATKIQVEIYQKLQPLLEKADVLEGELDIELYEMPDGLTVYLDDAVVNTFFGGIIDAKKLVEGTNSITVNGETVDIANRNSLRRGLNQCFDLINYDSEKPDTSIPVVKALNNLKN